MAFDCTDDSFEQLDKRIADAIYAYNYVRPHQGIQMRTPMEYIRKCSGKVAEVPLVGTGAPAARAIPERRVLLFNESLQPEVLHL